MLIKLINSHLNQNKIQDYLLVTHAYVILVYADVNNTISFDMFSPGTAYKIM